MSGPIDLIKKSFQIFFEKKNLVYFLKIYLPLLPFAVFFFFENSYANRIVQNLNLSDPQSFLNSLGWLPVFGLVVGLGYLIVSFWIGAAGIKAVSNAVNGGELGVKETYRFSWNKLWIFSLLSILVGLLVGVGYLLLIIPGIIFTVWYHFSGFEILTKDVGIGAAMSGSKRLVSSKFWPVFGRFIVFAIFGILAQIVFDILPAGTGSIIQPLFGALFILPYFLLYKELNG